MRSQLAKLPSMLCQRNEHVARQFSMMESGNLKALLEGDSGIGTEIVL